MFPKVALLAAPLPLERRTRYRIFWVMCESVSHLRMSDPASGIVGQVTADLRRITAKALSE
jgi:hypothetical protein